MSADVRIRSTSILASTMHIIVFAVCVRTCAHQEGPEGNTRVLYIVRLVTGLPQYSTCIQRPAGSNRR